MKAGNTKRKMLFFILLVPTMGKKLTLKMPFVQRTEKAARSYLRTFVIIIIISLLLFKEQSTAKWLHGTKI